MIVIFKDFVISTFHDIPFYIYVLLLLLLCIVILLVHFTIGFRRGRKLIIRCALVEYVFYVFCYTVLYRSSNSVSEYDFNPFWSYIANKNGEYPNLLPENIMNIVAFMPLGFLLGAGFQKMKWWKVVLIGVLISVIIESLQYFFKLGMSETDDVMHNTLGCFFGYVLYSLVRKVYRRFYKERIVL